MRPGHNSLFCSKKPAYLSPLLGGDWCLGKANVFSIPFLLVGDWWCQGSCNCLRPGGGVGCWPAWGILQVRDKGLLPQDTAVAMAPGVYLAPTVIEMAPEEVWQRTSWDNDQVPAPVASEPCWPQTAMSLFGWEWNQKEWRARVSSFWASASWCVPTPQGSLGKEGLQSSVFGKLAHGKPSWGKGHSAPEKNQGSEKVCSKKPAYFV